MDWTLLRRLLDEFVSNLSLGSAHSRFGVDHGAVTPAGPRIGTITAQKAVSKRYGFQAIAEELEAFRPDPDETGDVEIAGCAPNVVTNVTFEDCVNVWHERKIAGKASWSVWGQGGVDRLLLA